MRDAFGVDREQVAKAYVPKQMVTLLRYSKAPAKVGGSGSRMGPAANARVAARQNAGRPAESLTRAFAGMGRAQAPKPAVNPAAGQEAFTRAMAGATAKPKGPTPGPKPKPPTKPAARDLFAERGNRVVATARARAADRKRKVKFVAGTSAAAAGSGGAVLGIDAINDRRKAGRPSVSA